MVESVGSAEESEDSLADRLWRVPQKFAEYLTEASKNYVAQALGLVKSYWPRAKIGVLGDGMCSTCDHDQFVKFVEEAEPVADRIVKLVDQYDVLPLSFCHVNMTFLGFLRAFLGCPSCVIVEIVSLPSCGQVALFRR